MMKGMVAHLRGEQAAAMSDLQRVADFYSRIHTAIAQFLPPKPDLQIPPHILQSHLLSAPSRLPTPPLQHPQTQNLNLLNFASPLFSRRTTVTSQTHDPRAPPT